jgi:hypothetical protein
MRRVFKSSVRGVAVAVIFALAGSAFGASHDTRDNGRARSREVGIVKIVKKMVRSLGDGLIVPLPKPIP